MTLQQRNSPHKMLVARQRTRDPPVSLPADPTTSDPPSRTSVSPSPSSAPIPSPSDPPSSSPTRSSDPVVSSSTPRPSESSIAPSTSSTTSPTTTPSTTTRPASTTTSTRRVTSTNGDPVSNTSYNSLPTVIDDSATSTISADPTASGTSAVSAGTVAGGILGGLAGLAVLGFVIAFFLRRMNRRNRRRRLAMRPQSEYSTFGTFGPPGASSAEDKFDDIREKGHNVAPSISSAVAMNIAGYGSGPAAPDMSAGPSGVVLPSETFAASNDSGPTAIGAPQLHERPKYVFGQNPADGGDPDGNHTGMEEEMGHGPYSTQPVAQSAYDQEAYAYAGGNGYQEAERAYQQGAGGYYDQNGYYYPAAGEADANAYAAGAGQYYDYSQYPQQQQPQGHVQAQGQAAHGAM